MSLFQILYTVIGSLFIPLYIVIYNFEYSMPQKTVKAVYAAYFLFMAIFAVTGIIFVNNYFVI